MSEQPLLMGPSLDEAVAEAHAIIEQARSTYPHVAVVALFSGGNDSTTLLHLCRDLLVDTGGFALHINTGIGIEQTREFVRQTCSDWLVTLDERKTDPAWYRQQVLSRGFPGPVAHNVMFHNLKRARLREMGRATKEKRGDKVMLLTGERAYESQRRMGYGGTVDRQVDGFIWVNPIHFFTDWHMWQYRELHGIPRNPVSDRIHKSGECLCGAMSSRSELDEIGLWYPDTAAVLYDLERQAAEAGHGKRAKWAWGAADRFRVKNAPGVLCSSCHQTAMPLEGLEAAS